MDSPPPLDILLVEDDPAACANLLNVLKMDGHRVETAGTAFEGLGRRNLATFSVIIIGRKFPDAIAEHMLSELHRVAPKTSVMILTSYADLHGAISALRHGATDYILQPFSPEALRVSLSRIADRERLATAKTRSEAAFQQLVEAAECLIIITRPDRSILYINPFAEWVTGFSVHEVIGKSYDSRFCTEKVRCPMVEFTERVLNHERISGYEWAITCRDGSHRWIVWNAQLLDDYEGGPAILGVGQDITELKRAQSLALRSERLAAIGQMVTGLAHESRNALQRGQACLEMLALTDQDRPRSLNLIARIERAQDDLHRLFEDVRCYAAPIRLNRNTSTISNAWRDAWADLEPLRRGRDASIRESFDDSNSCGNIDAFHLRQVFRNLFDNALAACSDPVEILIHCEPTEVEGQAVLKITVSDNGPGPDPKDSAKLFEPFYTTKTKGTGLGLAIARRIVEAHGGRIELIEPERSGAVFLIMIPTSEPSFDRSTSPSSTMIPAFESKNMRP